MLVILIPKPIYKSIINIDLYQYLQDNYRIKILAFPQLVPIEMTTIDDQPVTQSIFLFDICGTVLVPIH